jgi:hypothetical protein
VVKAGLALSASDVCFSNIGDDGRLPVDDVIECRSSRFVADIGLDAFGALTPVRSSSLESSCKPGYTKDF